jgi:hypothetical protein
MMMQVNAMRRECSLEKANFRSGCRNVTLVSNDGTEPDILPFINEYLEGFFATAVPPQLPIPHIQLKPFQNGDHEFRRKET